MRKKKAKLKAPFVWFGGKSKVASFVWSRFGEVDNYCEPFFGSGAVLLGRNAPVKVETVNDLDCLLVNFWRGIRFNPDAVAAHADWPASEPDLYARHKYLVSLSQSEDFVTKMDDPKFFNAEAAGLWVWGASQWIGQGWCRAGRNTPRQMPILTGAQGIGARGDVRSAASPVNYRKAATLRWFKILQNRLRETRILCGDWRRLLTPATTTYHGKTAMFFDPPYAASTGRAKKLYAVESETVSNDVRNWCIENGENPLLRIALCGYDGEHDMPDGWAVYEWAANGGYSNQGGPSENRKRERIWFSPHCIKERETQMEMLHEHSIPERYRDGGEDSP